MLFNIFNRWSKKERSSREIKRLMREICKASNPDLISKLKEEKDQGKIYFAIKEVTQDSISRRMPELYEESKQIMRRVGTARLIEGLESISKDDPQTVFLWLVEIYARLLTEEEFRKFFRNSSEFSSEFMDIVIFDNPNLNLQFRRD